MEAILFIGVQGSGKSTFYRERFFHTHVRLNLDMLRTRHREAILLAACLEAKQPFVVDNTNPTRRDRDRYIRLARAARFRVVGYYFHCDLPRCKQWNMQRPADRVVPLPGLLGTYKRMTEPTLAEGFDELFYVRPDKDERFRVQPWPPEQ